MKLKEFGKTGSKVSEIGMGTYYDPLWIATAFGGWKRGAAAKVGAIKAGLDAGITLVDTAEIYGSEPLVAKAMGEAKRDEVFLATKVWSNHLHRDDLINSFDKSLRRLGTSYLDLYQVHFPNRRVPIKETMAAMEKLVGDGKLRHIGVSNFSLEQIKEARSSLPKSELSSVQLDYSLVHRSVEGDILPYCEEEKIALMAYYPLGHGKLPSDPKLDSISSSRGKTRAQVALRWLADKATVFPIPRASKESHVRDNAAAGDWELSDKERADLDLKFR
ncbi:MAG: aldo/keto reductase [Nitrososphaerota archaeon]|nr:aldo/keto reductase [Nitrososphaerota archaeon]MDG6953268.1 aldo/keto reductase [Nitrososphaerota archaeon]MDG6958532.1 aldo/keto reductase [Nitrososphaerota archaeon]MDG6965857.1 aldo/keto reductase [Nitrososphaerota archaeon]